MLNRHPRQVAIATFLLVVVACKSKDDAAPIPEGPAQTIHVDERHNHASGEDSASSYLISATRELLLDYSDYKFAEGQGDSSPPNAIHLICGEETYYRAPWIAGKSIRLNSKNLRSVRGDEFVGLRSGTSCILGIGADNHPAKQLSFQPMWAGIVVVEK